MPVKVECPHCHRMLAVPTKFLGATTNCPQCEGAFRMPAQVPPQAMTDDSEETPIAQPTSQGSPTQTAPKPAGSRPMQQSGSSPTARRQGQAAVAGDGSWMTNQVARFITADSAESRIQPEEDGSLPQLSLEELASGKGGQRKESSSNPALLVIALCCSIGASLVMLLVDAGPSTSRRQQIADSRKEIEAKFFRDPQPCPNSSCRNSDPRYVPGGSDHNWRCDACGHSWRVDPAEKPKPPKEYQVLLRRAQQAYSRGDRESERRNYRQVLKLLHAEERSQFVGLTDPRGTVRDKLLERLIAEILRE